MSKTKIITPSTDVMTVMIHRELIPVAGEYEKVNSTTSSMDEPFTCSVI